MKIPTILNGPVSKIPVDLNNASMEVRNWTTSTYPTIRQLSILVCGQWECNAQKFHQE
jgi:hypothetical protein